MKLNNTFKSIPFEKKTGIYIFILVLPFLVFYWQVPFLSSQTIGNDYVGCTIQEQMELQYALLHGFFPLYVPGFHGGQSSSALTLGQLYHPFPHLAANLPGYWKGNAIRWLTLLRLLSLGLVHLGLFILLRRLHINTVFSFIISFITVYNLRMLDLFRMGGLENYTGYLLLCMAVAFYYIKSTRLSGPISMMAATYLMMCGGHPQIMYYGLLGAAVTAIAIPFVLTGISAEIKTTSPPPVKYITTTGISIFCGILLSSAYTFPFYFDFVTTNARRIGQGYKWSLQFGDTVGGIVNNFFTPLHSDVNAAFGGTTLILLAALVPLLYLMRKKIPPAIIAVWVLLVLVFLLGLGGATPVHYFFWKYVPFASNFRAPGRIFMLFPFLVLLLLAWLFRSPQEKNTSPGKPLVFPYQLLALAAIPLFLFYNPWLSKYLPKPGHFTPEKIHLYPQWVDPFISWMGLLSLILVVLYSFYMKKFAGKWKPAIGILLSIIIMAQVTVGIRYGTWVIKKRLQPTLEKIDQKKKKKLTYSGSGGYGMETIGVVRQLQKSILEPALAKFYRKYKRASGQRQAYRFLNKENVTDMLVIEVKKGEAEREAKRDIKSRDKTRTHPGPHDRVELEENTFNRLVFSVEAGAPGFLAFSFPYTDKWSAAINGTSTRVYRANGYMQAVYLEAGRHKVEFRYWSPAAFAGILVSCLAFLIISIYFAFFVLAGKQRVILVTIAVLVPAYLLFAWGTGLYSGDNLGTRYTWSGKEFPPQNNLAYAKKASMDRQRTLFYAGFGVDGQAGRPFRTGRKKGWWQVDLGSPKPIGEIVIYDKAFNGKKHLPLQIQCSLNGKTFKSCKSLMQRGQEQPWRIPMNGEITRFIRLQSPAKIPLSFNEVEIYPPAGTEEKEITPQNIVDLLLEKTESSNIKEINVWNKNGPTPGEICPMLITFAKWGTVKIDAVKDNGQNLLQIRITEPGKDGIRKLHLGYEFNRSGLDMEIPEGKTIHFIVRAAVSPGLLNKDNFIAVQDFDRRWNSSRTYFRSNKQTTYVTSKKVRSGAKRLVLMIKFTPQSSTDAIILEDVRLLVSGKIP